METIDINKNNFINLFVDGKLQINCKTEKEAKKLFKRIISFKLIKQWLSCEKISSDLTRWDGEDTTYLIKTVKLYPEVLRIGVKAELRSGLVSSGVKLFGSDKLYTITFAESEKIFKVLEAEMKAQEENKEELPQPEPVKKPEKESKPKKTAKPKTEKPKKKMDYSNMTKAELKAILDKRKVRHLYHDTLDILRKKCEESE